MSSALDKDADIPHIPFSDMSLILEESRLKLLQLVDEPHPCPEGLRTVAQNLKGLCTTVNRQVLERLETEIDAGSDRGALSKAQTDCSLAAIHIRSAKGTADSPHEVSRLIEALSFLSRARVSLVNFV